MLHLLLLVSVAAAAELSSDWSIGAPVVVGSLPSAKNTQQKSINDHQRPSPWWSSTGQRPFSGTRSAGLSLLCSTNTGERCDSGLEAALREILQLDEKNPSLASNFRLLVPVPISQDNDPVKSPSKTYKHRFSGQQDIYKEDYFNKNEGDRNKYYHDIAKYASDLAKQDRNVAAHDHDISSNDVNFRGVDSYDQQLHDDGFRWMKINWHGTNDGEDGKRDQGIRDVLSGQNAQSPDQKKPSIKLNLYGGKLDNRDNGNIKLNDDVILVDNDQIFKLNGYDNRYVLSDQNAKLRDQKKRFIKVNVYGLKVDDLKNGNVKPNDGVILVNNNRDIKLIENENRDLLNDKNTKSLDENNRLVKIKLYGENFNDQDNGNINLDDDVILVDSDRDFKFHDHDNRDPLHDHKVRLVDQDNRVVDDIIMHDHEFLVVDEEKPSHRPYLDAKKKGLEVEDGLFSEIPSSEFTRDSVEHQLSVKKDLSAGTAWLDNVCQSMEHNREASDVVGDGSQKCGLCCRMQRQLMELVDPHPTQPVSRLTDFTDLTRPATDFSKEEFPEDLQNMLEQLLASRRVDVRIFNAKQPN